MISRRKLLYVAGAATTISAGHRIYLAQAYPVRPVRIMVGVSSGGAFDILARLTGQWLSERLAQSFVLKTGRVPAATSPPRPRPSLGQGDPDGQHHVRVTVADSRVHWAGLSKRSIPCDER